MTAADLVTASIVFVALPLVFVWGARDSIRRFHVITLFVLALICGVVAVLSLGWAKASPSGLARLAPAFLLLGAGALGGVLLSSALMSLIARILRDEDAAEFRREARKYSHEPKRPSMAPLSRDEVDVRFPFSLGAMSAWTVVMYVRYSRAQSAGFRSP